MQSWAEAGVERYGSLEASRAELEKTLAAGRPHLIRKRKERA